MVTLEEHLEALEKGIQDVEAEVSVISGFGTRDKPVARILGMVRRYLNLHVEFQRLHQVGELIAAGKERFVDTPKGLPGEIEEINNRARALQAQEAFRRLDGARKTLDGLRSRVMTELQWAETQHKS